MTDWTTFDQKFAAAMSFFAAKQPSVVSPRCVRLWSWVTRFTSTLLTSCEDSIGKCECSIRKYITRGRSEDRQDHLKEPKLGSCFVKLTRTSTHINRGHQWTRKCECGRGKYYMRCCRYLVELFIAFQKRVCETL
ncbi:uncharacterized protein LOC120339277 [Styela clava]